MKRLIIAAACVLAASILAHWAVAIYAQVARGAGVQFGGMDSPEAAFPLAVFFGTLWLIPLSALVLVVLVGVAIVRAYLPRNARNLGDSEISRTRSQSMS